MESIAIEDAERRLTELAGRAEQGETIVITRNGKPVASLVPPSGRRSGIDFDGGRQFLRERGIDNVANFLACDFDDPLPENVLITPLPACEPTSQ